MEKNILDKINDIVDGLEPELKKLALDIHDNPELGLEEFKACQWQVDLLTKYGFQVETNYCGIPTAYRATYKGAKAGPRIGMLGEYDALPGLGHACGHNLICTMAVGSGIAMREFADEFGGEIVVIGTPAEETAGAKVEMSKKGAFDDLDVAMMSHPAYADCDSLNTNAIKCFQVEFFGRAAHAAAFPEDGINALDAMIQLFSGVGLLRQQVKDGSRIHGVILDGGKAPNIIPDYTKALFYARAPRFAYAMEISERIYDIARGASLATGCRVEINDAEEDFKDTCSNRYLSDLMADNMETYLGHKFLRSGGIAIAGSSDIGDVSYCCPAIQTTTSLSAPGDETVYKPHTPEFAVRTGTEQAVKNCMDFVKGFTITAIQLMTEPKHLEAIREEFSHINDPKASKGFVSPL
ncbi:MAG: M20 family metallopeptidase [Clostridiales bacterium]|nr:M20 family metallopeptidase [Clostridiales bacterium]